MIIIHKGRLFTTISNLAEYMGVSYVEARSKVGGVLCAGWDTSSGWAILEGEQEQDANQLRKAVSITAGDAFEKLNCSIRRSKACVKEYTEKLSLAQGTLDDLEALAADTLAAKQTAYDYIDSLELE